MNGKERWFIVLLGILWAGCSLRAQNIYVDPPKGSLIAANTEGLGYSETGAPYGWRALWRHNQLPLAMIVADYPDLTEGGEMKKPAGNMVITKQDPQTNAIVSDASTGGVERFALIGGSGSDCYISVTLPYGFRITGYRIVLLNNLNGQSSVHNKSFKNEGKTIYETNNRFDTSSPLAQVTLPAGTASQEKSHEYELTRTSLTLGEDMQNHLYFRCVRSGSYSGIVGFSIKSFVVYYTTYGGSTIDVRPLRVVTQKSSFMDEPFATGRMEIGDLSTYTPENATSETCFAFYAADVASLMANNVLYGADAVGSDGLVDRTGALGQRTINSVYNEGYSTEDKGYYFALSGNKTYFLETPVETSNRDGGELPLSYRITGVRLHYLYGQPTSAATNERQGMITCHNSAGTTLYLKKNGLFTEDIGDACTWVYSEQNGSDNGIHSEDGQTWLCAVERKETIVWIFERLTGSSLSTTETEPQSGMKIHSDSNGHLYYTDSEREKRYLEAVQSATDVAEFKTSVSNYVTRNPTTIEPFAPHDYQISLYGADGQSVVQTKNVNASDRSGTMELYGLNNDAVKFAISGLDDDANSTAAALVRFDLVVETLNPYLNRVKVTCQDPSATYKVAQVFQSDDFKIKGEKLVLYVPEGFSQRPDYYCSINFEEAYNHCGDLSYYNGVTSGNARYSLVGSDYYQSTPSLYDTSYDVNAPYQTKVRTSLVGNQPFKMSNIEDLLATPPSSGQRMRFQEWHFTPERYTSQGGTLEPLRLKNQSTKNVYLISCDETKYNIAPTFGTQHRMYAFYDTRVEVEEKDFVQAHEWVRIYDSCTARKKIQNREVDDNAAKWGLRVFTTEQVNGEYGYLRYDNIEPIFQEVGTDDERYPHEMGDILYVDLSDLQSIIYDSQEESQQMNSLQLLRTRIAPNGLIYLPQSVTMKAENSENFAYKVDNGVYRSVMDIVLKDKYPFFAPYRIQVPAAAKARYEREVSAPGYVKPTLATVILPFNLRLTQEGGYYHINRDDGCKLSFHQMQASNCLNVEDPAKTKTYFSTMSQTDNLQSTTANTPYMVQVVSKPQGQTANSFSIHQMGATIVPSERQGVQGSALAKTTYDGETATGRFGTSNVTFLNHGTYSGMSLPIEDNYFYFARDCFYNSVNVTTSPVVVVYPFRSYYSTTGLSPRQNIKQMIVDFQENPYTTSINGVPTIDQCAPFGLSSAIGGLTVEAYEACHIGVTSVSGVPMAAFSLAEGQRRTVTLPKGVYLVNGRKCVVK